MGFLRRLSSIDDAVRCLLNRSDTDAYLLSLQQSGTHWLRMLLVRYLKEFYDIEYNFDDLDLSDFISHPRSDPDINLGEAPTIRSTHHAYWFLYRNKNVVLLVRHLRKSILSGYEKMLKVNNTSLDFEAFLKGDFDPQNFRYVTPDLPHRVRFLNRWAKYGFDRARIQLVKFEDLKNNTIKIFREVLEFLGIPTENSLIQKTIDRSSKDSMRELGKESSKRHRRAISKKDKRDPTSFFTPTTEQYFLSYLRENLEHDYGYHYEAKLPDTSD